MYYRWRRFLPENVQLVPILMAGREGRYAEPAYSDLPTVLAAILPALAAAFGQVTPEPGWILFGHSLGALLAHQIAVLAADYRIPPPAVLIVSSCPAPQLLPRPETLHDLPDDVLLTRLVQQYGLTGQDADSEYQLMRLMLPTLRADLRMFESYRFDGQPPLQVPLFALGGADDRQVTRTDLERWRDRTTASFRTRVFAGGHFYLRSHEQSVAEFVGQVAAHHVTP